MPDMHYYRYEDYKQFIRILYIVAFYWCGLRCIIGIRINDRYKNLPAPIYRWTTIKGIIFLVCGAALNAALFFFGASAYLACCIPVTLAIAACGLYSRYLKRRFPFKLDSGTKD